MRERLRLYIYPTDFHCDQRRPKNTNRGYMAEWNFYDRARKSSLRVTWRIIDMVQDPENASIYYIPTFTSCWRSQGRSRGEGGQQAGKRMQQMLKDVASNFPFFQRNHGQRHIWVSAHDMGKAEPLLVGCKQNTGPSLCSDAALSLTEMLAKNSSALVNTADDAEHTKLESFAACGLGGDGGSWFAYERSLAESDLCLAPRGSRVWSPRLFEMIWFGCIPAGQILKTYLDDPKRLEQMRRKVFRIRKTFMWHDEDTNGDAFELALLDVYLKQQRQCG
ncbi:Probable glycosyltransferase At5g11130 [Durusdinium trenchii]|uniref:Probable glycosyltransferase At5g11130 n=1 Tax=Durusdinium trenchii TaxID=1381693 RepID=A0ABP0PTI8_9DINO